jgi:transcriptional antiterminator NusG
MSMNNETKFFIESIDGVMSFVGPKGSPQAVTELEMARYLSISEGDDLSGDDYEEIPFKVGDSVKVIDGPFNGFPGSIDNVNEEKRKLEVMVKIFGRKTPLDLSYMQVEKI